MTTKWATDQSRSRILDSDITNINILSNLITGVFVNTRDTRDATTSTCHHGSVVDSTVVSRRVDIGPVRSYKRSCWRGYRQRAWSVLIVDARTKRDESIRVYLHPTHK